MDREGIIFLRRLTVLIFFAVLMVCFAASAKAADFRGFIWGVSKEDVRKYERAIFYKEEGDSLYFLLQPDYFRRLIRYDFKDGKLFRARYEYVELFTPQSLDIIARYLDLKDKVSKEYKMQPVEDLEWRDKTYANYPQYWPNAFMGRDLIFRATWAFGNTRVLMETYHEKTYYQLYYQAEQVAAQSKDNDRNILNLPLPAQ